MTQQKLPTLQVQDKELAIVLGLLEKHAPGYTVLAFGSRVGGTPKTFSDLDLAFIGTSPLPLIKRAELGHAFSESDLPWKVDLVDWHSISPAFQQIIQANCITLHTAMSIKPNKSYDKT